MHRLRDGDQFGKLDLQIFRDEKLELFGGEAGELLRQSVKDRRVIQLCVGKGFDDGDRLANDLVGFVRAEFFPPVIPLIEFLDRVG